MSNFYNNPELTLKRATEYLELGKKDEAVGYLYDILKNKKNRIHKSVYEAVIKKFIELCVDLRLASTAKDGLYLYRALCFGTDVRSWEDSINRLIHLAEQKVEMKAEVLVVGNTTTVVDLDQAVTPDSVLKLAIHKNDSRQSENDMFLWIKFSWDCYRISLDLLRNTQVGEFYHHVARKAMHFCLKYQRKSEFRRLCYTFRMHVGYLNKQKTNFLTSLNNPEVNMLYLETGLVELEVSFELELWQEVYKAIENLHQLFGTEKKHGNSRIIANYYKKLSNIFLKTGDAIYHAAALLRYFALLQEFKKSLNPSDITSLSSAVVLSILAIPLPPTCQQTKKYLLAENDISFIENKHRLLSEMLGFQNKLSRNKMIRDIELSEILQSSHMQVQKLFNLIKNEFDPLNMGKKILNFAREFKDSSASNQTTINLYLNSINNVSVAFLLIQLSKAYKTITWKKFMSLVPISDEFYVEKLVVEKARKFDIPVRIDHLNACLRFESNHFQNSSYEDIIMVHQLSNGKNQSYLSHVYTSLGKIAKCLKFEFFKSQDDIVRRTVTERYFEVLYEDRKGILQRKKIIEKHKEMVEITRLKKEEEERNLITAKQSEFEAAEKERLLKEAEQRAHQKLILKQEEIRKKTLLEKIEILKKTELKEMVEKLDVNELEDLDPEVILSKHLEQVTRERKGLVSRMRKQERTIFHMERAKRIEEVPLLVEKYEGEKTEIKDTWEKTELLRIEMVIEKRAHNVKEKSRLMVMGKDLEYFKGKLLERRKLEYEKSCDDFQKRLEKERKKRLNERATKRKIQRKYEWANEQKNANKILVKKMWSDKKERKEKISPNIKSSVSVTDDKNEKNPKSPYESKFQKILNTPRSPKKLLNIMDNLNKYQSLKEDKIDRRCSNSVETPQNFAEKNNQNRIQNREVPSEWRRSENQHLQKNFKTQSFSTTANKRDFMFKDKISGKSNHEYDSGRKFIGSQLQCTSEETYGFSGQQKLLTKNLGNKTYLERQTYDARQNLKISEPSLRFSNQQDSKTFCSTKENFEVSHSCTPWAKLQREKPQ